MTPERKQELEEVAKLIGSILELHKAKIITNTQITPMEDEIKTEVEPTPEIVEPVSEPVSEPVTEVPAEAPAEASPSTE